VATYSYDFTGRRVSKTVYGSPNVTTKYYYDGDQVIAELKGLSYSMNKKNKRKWRRLIVVASIILAGISLIGLFFLPDGKMGSKVTSNTSISWLLIGVIHSVLVLFLLIYFIVGVSQDKGLKSCLTIKMVLVISIVILWLLLVESNVRSGYLRTRNIKIPKSILPKEGLPVEMPIKNSHGRYNYSGTVKRLWGSKLRIPSSQFPHTAYFNI